MKIESLETHTINDEDVAQRLYIWQYKFYVDIRGGSQDLCKFCLGLRVHVSIYRPKEGYGIPYSLSSSRRWFVTLSY